MSYGNYYYFDGQEWVFDDQEWVLSYDEDDELLPLVKTKDSDSLARLHMRRNTRAAIKTRRQIKKIQPGRVVHNVLKKLKKNHKVSRHEKKQIDFN